MRRCARAQHARDREEVRGTSEGVWCRRVVGRAPMACRHKARLRRALPSTCIRRDPLADQLCQPLLEPIEGCGRRRLGMAREPPVVVHWYEEEIGLLRVMHALGVPLQKEVEVHIEIVLSPARHGGVPRCDGQRLWSQGGIPKRMRAVRAGVVPWLRRHTCSGAAGKTASRRVLDTCPNMARLHTHTGAKRCVRRQIAKVGAVIPDFATWSALAECVGSLRVIICTACPAPCSGCLSTAPAAKEVLRMRAMSTRHA